MKKIDQIKKKNDVLRFVSALSDKDLVSLENHLIAENYEIDTKEIEDQKSTSLLESLSIDPELINEDVQQKLKVIFESAVAVKTQEQVAKFIAEQEQVFEQYSSTIKEELEETYKNSFHELEENLDAYLDYVIQEWSEENKLAIEEGVKTQISESVLTGLKRLFDDNYIDVPSEKISLISTLEKKVDKLYSTNISLNEKNKELSETTVALKKRLIVEDLSKNLTLPQKERLVALSENVQAKTSKEFKKQVETLVTLLKEEKPTPAKSSSSLLSEECSYNSDKSIDPSVKKYLEMIEKM